MKKRIRQGHTRWRVRIEYDKLTGRPAVAWVEQCLAMAVDSMRVLYSTEGQLKLTSHKGWMRMQPTYRKAMRCALEIIDQANREIHREYADAWLHKKD